MTETKSNPAGERTHDYIPALVLCLDNSMGGEHSVGIAGEHCAGCIEGVRVYHRRSALSNLHYGNAPMICALIQQAKTDDSQHAGHGWGNCWFIRIDEAQVAELIALDKQAGEAAARREIEQEIEDLEASVAGLDRSKLGTSEDARRAERRYNDINNEGGEGYVPHIVSRSEYDYTVARIAQLKQQLA